MSQRILNMIDNARVLAGVPFVITSGSRCASHNKRIGGSPTSSHLEGVAIDIATDNSAYRLKIIEALIEVGFGRIGIAKNFVHVDTDVSKPQNIMWVYK